MPFAVAAAGIGAVGTIAGGIMQSNAVKGAASQARNDLAPWRTTGQSALTATSDLLGLNGDEAADAAFGNFRTSPGYQWQLDQGLRAIDAGAAARGLVRSGATLKAEMEYGQGLADREFSDYYARLAGLSDQGLKAAGGQASASQAAGQGQANILGNTFSGLGNIANSLLSNQQFQSWWNTPSPGPSSGIDAVNNFNATW